MSNKHIDPEEFQIVWNSSGSVTEVVAHFDITEGSAVQRASRMRRDGYSMKFMGSKGKVDWDEFVRIWNLSQSVTEVAERLHISYATASGRARMARRKGIKLRDMERRVVRKSTTEMLHEILQRLDRIEALLKGNQ